MVFILPLVKTRYAGCQGTRMAHPHRPLLRVSAIHRIDRAYPQLALNARPNRR